MFPSRRDNQRGGGVVDPPPAPASPILAKASPEVAPALPAKLPLASAKVPLAPGGGGRMTVY